MNRLRVVAPCLLLVGCVQVTSLGSDLSDAGRGKDAALDAAVADAHPDVGLPVDAGSTPDIGAPPDVGAASDAGSTSDIGATPDAGAASDAGSTSDIGATPDAGAASDASAQPMTWHWESPQPWGYNLSGIWGSSKTDIWAVGDGIFHWDGSAWTRTAMPSDQPLYAVWGTGAQDVWAVGDIGIILHWDGSAWCRVTSGTTAMLRAIWGSSPNQVWAVGYERYDCLQTNPPPSSVILRWDGSVWSRAFQSDARRLTSIWGWEANDVLALGVSGASVNGCAMSGTLHRDLVRWNGSTWTASEDQSLGNIAVWGISPTDVWSGGTSGLAHWNGSSWTPTFGWDATALWGASASDVWAAGADLRHWNGQSWTASGQAWPWDPLQHQPAFTAVWGTTSDDVWAVGLGGMIAHKTGALWSASAARVTIDWRDVTSFGLGSAVAVGPGGAIHRWNGSGWTTSRPHTADLYGVWGVSDSEVWAVGDGAVLHWNGATWTAETGLASNLRVVHGSSKANVWAAGEAGAVLHWNGTTWTQRTLGTEAVTGIWTATTSDTWAVSTGLHRWNGSQWASVGGLAQTPRAVWGSSAQDVWVVGDGGSIARFDGMSWTALSSGTTYPLLAISGRSANDVWIAGGWTGRVLLHWDGVTLQRMDLPWPHPLTFLEVGPAGDVWTGTREPTVNLDALLHLAP